LYVPQCSEILAGHLHNDQVAAIPLLSKSANAHATSGKREPHGDIKTERRIKTDIRLLSGLIGSGHQPAFR
jgi:hypothetical protein